MADEKQTGVPSGWSIVEEAAPASSSASDKPGTSTAITTATAQPLVRGATRAALEVATNPNVARTAATAGQVIGGVEGAIHGGPMGAAGGVWTGGKAGWHTGKLAQRMAAPVAALAEKLAPYAQTVATLSGAQGVNDLAQMAEPNRRDIGVMGVTAGETQMDPQHPALINEALARVAERLGRKDIADLWRGKK